MASVARPRPGLGLPRVLPFPLLLLMAVLNSPVSGRVPHSVPRTSLPISGKAPTPSPLALRAATRPRLQVPEPTCPPPPPRRPRPAGCRRDAHVVLHHQAGRFGSHDTPKAALPPLQTWALRPRKGVGVARDSLFRSFLPLNPVFPLMPDAYQIHQSFTLPQTPILLSTSLAFSSALFSNSIPYHQF